VSIFLVLTYGLKFALDGTSSNPNQNDLITLIGGSSGAGRWLAASIFACLQDFLFNRPVGIIVFVLIGHYLAKKARNSPSEYVVDVRVQSAAEIADGPSTSDVRSASSNGL
jgi:cation transport ATPase